MCYFFFFSMGGNECCSFRDAEGEVWEGGFLRPLILMTT